MARRECTPDYCCVYLDEDVNGDNSSILMGVVIKESKIPEFKMELDDIALQAYQNSISVNLHEQVTAANKIIKELNEMLENLSKTYNSLVATFDVLHTAQEKTFERYSYKKISQRSVGINVKIIPKSFDVKNEENSDETKKVDNEAMDADKDSVKSETNEESCKEASGDNYEEEAMSSISQKHRNFVLEPMGDKGLNESSGIGEVLSERLEAKGFDKVVAPKS